MERLTFRLGEQNPSYGLENEAAAKPGLFTDYDGFYAHLQAVHKLGKYEDTGLSPDEVAELAQAKADGRLVVLPFAVGAKVYIIVRHGVLHDKILENVVCGYSESEWHGNANKGKDHRFVICHNSYNMPNAYELRNVFRSRQEAENALKEAQK